MTSHPFANRQLAVRKSLGSAWGALISQPADINYLSGFGFLVAAEREAFLLISQTETVLFYTSFSPVPNPPNCVLHAGCSIADIISYITQANPNSSEKSDSAAELMINELDLRVDEYKLLGKSNLNLISMPAQIMAELRRQKSDSETERIEQACRITSQVVSEILLSLKSEPQKWVGKTEQLVAQEVFGQMIKHGCSNLAFPIIVAFGENSAIPHHQPSDRQLKAEEVILIDCGVKFDGYCADMTRTVWFGQSPNQKFLEVESVVKGAYQAAGDLVSNFSTDQNLTPAQIDMTTRNYIAQAKFGPNFIHTTGHGLGLDIHEFPSISQRTLQPLSPSMVITIEPGIYLPGQFGYRHENTWLIMESGARPLSY